MYVKDDTQFNESFATAVEEVGVERWLAAHSDAKTRLMYADFAQRKKQFIALLMKYRQKLVDNYAADISDAEKRAYKKEIFAALQDDYQVLKTSWHGYAGYDRWFAEPLSNAHLASIATYHDFVPGFRALLREKKDFAEFYREVIALAALNKQERDQELINLGAPAGTHAHAVYPLDDH